MDIYLLAATAMLPQIGLFISVTVIPWFIRLSEEIIHELKRVDYLPYKQTNHFITIYITHISEDLAQY